MMKIKMIIPYDDYNSRIPPFEQWGYMGAITRNIGNSALRTAWKIIEVLDDGHYDKNKTSN